MLGAVAERDRSCTCCPARIRAPPSSARWRSSRSTTSASTCCRSCSWSARAAIRRRGRCRRCSSTASGSSARARSCAASTSCGPTRRCCRPPAQRRDVSRPRALGRRVLQDVARRVVLDRPAAPAGRDGELRRGRGLPMPVSLAVRSGPLIALLRAPLHSATRAARGARPRRAARPPRPDRRVDRRRARSAARRSPPPTSRSDRLRLLTTVEDVRPLIDGRPAGELARRLFERYRAGSPPARCRALAAGPA